MLFIPDYSRFSCGKIAVKLVYEEMSYLKFRIRHSGGEWIEFVKEKEAILFEYGDLMARQVLRFELEAFSTSWILIKELYVPVLDYTPNVENKNRIMPGSPIQKKEISNSHLPETRADNLGYDNEYDPSYYPSLHNQACYYDGKYVGEVNSCVAHTLAAIVEYFQNNEGHHSYKQCSVSWMWGGKTDGWGEKGMLYYNALNKLKSEGTPPWEMMAEPHIKGWSGEFRYPDVYYYYDKTVNGKSYRGARSVYNSKRSNILQYAQSQKIDSWEEVAVNGIIYYPAADDQIADYKRIQDAIIDKKKAVMMTLSLDQSFDDAMESSDGLGVVGDLKFSGRNSDGHSLMVTGWKKINGRRYWECQNSWGTVTSMGLVYIPFNWTAFERGINDQDTCGIISFYIIRDGSYTMPKPPRPDTPVYDTNKGVEGRDGPYVYVKTNSVPNASEYIFHYRDEQAETTYTKTSTIPETSIYFGSGNRRYVSVGVLYKDNTLSVRSLENLFTSAPNVPTIVLNRNDAKGVQIGFSKAHGADSVVTHRYNKDSAYIDSKEVAAINSQGVVDFPPSNQIIKFQSVSKKVVDGTIILSTSASNIIIVNPTTFEWDVPKNNQNNITVTSNEWNRLIDLIKSKGYTGTLNKVSVGNNFSSTVFNNVVAAMRVIGISNLPPTISKGNIVYINYFEQIKNGINSK